MIDHNLLKYIKNMEESTEFKVTLEVFKILLKNSNHLWSGDIDSVIDRAIEISQSFIEKYRISIQEPYSKEHTSTSSF